MIACLEVVFLAEQRVVAEVEHFARLQHLAAHGAGETLAVIDLVASFANQILGKNPLATTDTFRTETSERERENLHNPNSFVLFIAR